ncbi:hypothetical protein NX801_14010 [Streptomyces sp. LP05-1]|uniref:Uncharacterized protein n=1 Tax=Streptomyces pyxinae TaxID=2970734 RepID=A0ABT2CH77_9ACTN|nr:hypothetical protein [Streptomyces sp. LP05-1]MCS0636756.1 hypothetical protein [Streptomyces sp. LP05-1]
MLRRIPLVLAGLLAAGFLAATPAAAAGGGGDRDVEGGWLSGDYVQAGHVVVAHLDAGYFDIGD